MNDASNGIERRDKEETEKKMVEEPVRRTEVNTDETINGPDKLLNMKRNR